MDSFQQNALIAVDALIDRVRGKDLTLAQLAQRWRVDVAAARENLKLCALRGVVNYNEETRRFNITHKSVREWLANLQAEVSARRKANHDERGKRRWDPYQIDLKEQVAILDYVQEQLRNAPK